MTFSLAGFSTFKRDGLELTGTAVFTINADMRVGSLEETITVSGETPLVDVQSTTDKPSSTRKCSPRFRAPAIRSRPAS